MILYAFVAFAILALTDRIVWIAMKVRVASQLSGHRWLSLLDRDYREIPRRYRALYPESFLPDIFRLSRLLCLAILGLLLVNLIMHMLGI